MHDVSSAGGCDAVTAPRVFLGRAKDAATLSTYASCFPKIDSDFRADALGQAMEFS
jgi:hypothetical protein